MSNKTLAVGDLHGNYEIANKALATKHDVIFLGDYIDSYKRSVEDQLQCLDIVIEGIEKGRCVGLLGNHEKSYLHHNRSMVASGFNQITDLLLKDRNTNRLLPYIYSCGYLFSHAGISKVLLENLNMDLDTYIYNGDFSQIGYARGGRNVCGGLYWCDWNREFEPLEEIKQVVGHTRGIGIRNNNGNYCVDCVEDGYNDFLLIDNKTKKLETIKL